MFCFQYNNIKYEISEACHVPTFLLSAKARTLSVRKVMELTNAQAFEVFNELRWGAGDEVACPVCGTIGKHYFQRTRSQWRCKDCCHTFSVTSGKRCVFRDAPES